MDGHGIHFRRPVCAPRREREPHPAREVRELDSHDGGVVEVRKGPRRILPDHKVLMSSKKRGAYVVGKFTGVLAAVSWLLADAYWLLADVSWLLAGC